MFNRVIGFLHYKLLKLYKPEMIGKPYHLKKNTKNSFNISNTTHVSFKNDNLKMGNDVFIGHFNYIDAYNAKVEIGDNVQITNYVSILTHSTHNAIRFLLNEDLPNEILADLKDIGEIYIGESTYIGAHSVIMPNTSIGKKSIVGAFSYVKGSYPDYSIIRGIPAKVVGDTRDKDSEILKKFPELIKANKNQDL